MSDELQSLLVCWEALERQAKRIVFPASSRKGWSGKKRRGRAGIKVHEGHLNWYDFERIRWTTASTLWRLNQGEALRDFELMDVQILPIRLERFIWVARDGALRAYLHDLQHLLERIAAYVQSQQVS